MEVQTLKEETGILLCLADDGQEHGYLYAELVLCLSGGYVLVCVGIDIGIDTQGNMCSLAQSSATLGYHIQFSL